MNNNFNRIRGALTHFGIHIGLSESIFDTFYLKYI